MRTSLLSSATAPEPNPVNRLEAFLKSPLELEIDLQLKAARARAEAFQRAWRRRSRFHVTLLCSDGGVTELVKSVLKPPLKVVAFSKSVGSGFFEDIMNRSAVVILRHSPPEIDVTIVLGLIRQMNKIQSGMRMIVLGEPASLTGQTGPQELEPDAWLSPSNAGSDLESTVLKMAPPGPVGRARTDIAVAAIIRLATLARPSPPISSPLPP